jgi:2-dehydropantoate 2-reductase
MKNNAMHVAVMGAGAVGGYFGAKLAAVGHTVVFIARGEHLAALRREGLRVNSPAGALQVDKALFSAEAAHAGGAELILFCVKSYDTEAAVQALSSVMGSQTVLLSLQNGVDNADKIAHRFGDYRTLAGVVYVAAQVVSPGVIEHSSGGRIILGPRTGGDSPVAQTVAQALTDADIPCEMSADIQTALWRKLLWNAPFCAISSLTGATVEDIVESESLTKLAMDCMEEVRQAAKMRDIDLPPELFKEVFDFSKTLGPFKPSMLQDLQSGKPLEYEAFNGIVVKLLEDAGRKAPVNQVFYGALRYLDKKIRQEASGKNHG